MVQIIMHDDEVGNDVTATVLTLKKISLIVDDKAALFTDRLSLPLSLSLYLLLG